MPVRNQHPAQLTVLHLPAAPARVLADGAFVAHANAAYSSLWLSGAEGTRSWTMDGEYLRTALGARVGVGHDLEFGFEVPFAHSSGGFLDHFLIDYHDVLGLPDQGRPDNPVDRFGIGARRNGNTVWQVDASAFELLDVPLSLTWQVAAPQDGPVVALRAGIELPTGDDRRGYGNGQFDYAVGALFEHRALGCAWYGQVQHTFAGTPAQSRDFGFHFADVTSAAITGELPLDDGAAALVQVEWETSTLRDLDLRVTRREQVLLWGGLRIGLGDGWQAEVGFGEDLQGLVSPDFTAWLAVSWQPLPAAAAP